MDTKQYDSESEIIENEAIESVVKSVPERKKKTLTEKQLKNLELMRQKKMAKIEAQKMIQESVRNSAKQQEEEDFSNLKNEINLLKEQLNSRNKPVHEAKSKKVVKKKIHRTVEYSSSDSDDNNSNNNNSYTNPYLHQLVRFK